MLASTCLYSLYAWFTKSSCMSAMMCSILAVVPIKVGLYGCCKWVHVYEEADITCGLSAITIEFPTWTAQASEHRDIIELNATRRLPLISINRTKLVTYC